MNTTNKTDHGSWYVIQTKPKSEFYALMQLEQQSYQCFLPTLEQKKIVRGKLETRVEPLFSRYLFIHLDMHASNWAPIRSTRGVRQFVSFGGRPAVLHDAAVEAIRNTDWSDNAAHYRKGEQVRIVSGAFAGLEGIYDLPDGEMRAQVLIQIMSRPQRISLELEALRKAD